MHRHSSSRLGVLFVGAAIAAGCARHVTTSASPATTTTTSTSTTTSMSSSSSSAAAHAGLPATVTAQMIQEGDSIFNHGSCQRCHGMNGTNGRTAPDLTDNTWLHVDGSYESIVHIISTGVPAADFKSPTSRFPMRAMGGMPLTDEQLHAVAGYVYTLSHH